MHNSNIPQEQEIPSTKQLLKSTIWAAVVASVILVTIVMPAEYGIDPTGVGRLTGLTKMGEIKVSLAKEIEDDKAADGETVTAIASAASLPAEGAEASHELELTLDPDQGMEVKLAMRKGAVVNYEWFTDGAEAAFDVHGDSRELEIDYHNYYKGKDARREGSIDAAFDGSHGWWWRNRTDGPMTITLKTKGEYTEIKQYK